MTMFTKEINKDVPIPLYYQLKNIIKTDIENGTLKTGDTIPTEMEIMSHYNISPVSYTHLDVYKRQPDGCPGP